MSAFDILVIDDDVDNVVEPRQQWFAKSLAALGHQVTAAHSSSEAYRLLRERKFDLAFFDHDLGESATGSTIAGEVLYHPEEYQCPRAVWVHSHNPIGAENIASKFVSARVPTRVIAYCELKAMSLEALGRLISELLPTCLAESSELVALLDMDSSLVDYEGRLRERLRQTMSPMEEDWFRERESGLLDNPPAWLKTRERLIKHQPGFWFELPIIPFGLELYGLFGELGYKRVILTRGPHKNPMAWAEKMRWCEQYVPNASVTITTEDKGSVYGRVLYDDWPEYILSWLKARPRGKVLMLDAAYNRHLQHPNVLRCFRAPMHTQKELILQFLGT